MRQTTILLTTCLLLGGCYHWEPVSTDGRPDADDLIGTDGGVRVRLDDGMRVTLERFEVRNDTVYATSGQCRPEGIFVGTAVRAWCSGLAVPVSQIRTVESRVVDRIRSALAVLLSGLFGGALLVALLEMWSSGAGYHEGRERDRGREVRQLVVTGDQPSR